MTASEALQFLRDGLPADRGLDGERNTAIRTLVDSQLSAVLLLRVFVQQAAGEDEFGNACCDYCGHTGTDHHGDCLAASVRKWLKSLDEPWGPPFAVAPVDTVEDE